MSMNTRTVFAPHTRSSVTTRLHVNTSGLSQVGWKHVSEVTTLFLMSCTRCIRKPSSTVLTYKGYEINGNTFYTIDQDQKTTNQNSGVRFDAATKSGKETYYGYIVDIWELNYGDDFKVPLFKCKWVNMLGVQLDPQYGMTTVDLNNLGYPDEPFVLANDVAQIFYVKDMSTKPRKRKDKEANTSYDEPKRHIVLLGKKDIPGLEGKTDKPENYEKFHEISPFKVKADPSILLRDEDYPWLRLNKQNAQVKKK